MCITIYLIYILVATFRGTSGLRRPHRIPDRKVGHAADVWRLLARCQAPKWLSYDIPKPVAGVFLYPIHYPI